MENNKLDCIVFTWGTQTWKNIGGINLDSSYDNYGSEYGWTASHFAQARGGTGVYYYTLGIDALSLTTGKRVRIAKRFEDMPDNAAAGAAAYSNGIANVVLFYKSDGRLFDIGKYGIFDTLSGVKVASEPNLSDVLVKVEGNKAYLLRGEGNTELYSIDLGRGMATGRYEAVKDNKDEIALPELHKCISKMKPFNFLVDGKEFRVDIGTTADDWDVLETKGLYDDSKKLLIPANWMQTYIVAAVGFPESSVQGLR